MYWVRVSNRESGARRESLYDLMPLFRVYRGDGGYLRHRLCETLNDVACRHISCVFYAR
jgi:hypothetical protein